MHQAACGGWQPNQTIVERLKEGPVLYLQSPESSLDVHRCASAIQLLTCGGLEHAVLRASAVAAMASCWNLQQEHAD